MQLAARGFLRKIVPEVPISSSGQPLVLSLEPGYAVSGRVVDANGQPAVGATVLVDPRQLTGPERARLFEMESTADDDGNYRIDGLIPLDDYTFIARHEDHAPGWVEDVHLGPPDRETSGVDFHLQSGKAIRGRVLDEQGRPVAGAVVTCEFEIETCALAPLTPQGRVLRGLEVKETTSGQRGEYEFLHLAGDDYFLSAAAEGRLPARTHVHDLGDEGTSADGIDLYMRAPQSLRGRVVDGDGAPLAGVRVRSYAGEIVTDESAAFAFQGLWSGRTSVTASLEGYEEVVRGVRVPAEDVSLVLRRLAVLTGRIRTGRQTALPRTTVRALGEPDVEWTTRSSGDDDGAFELAVPGGRYVVQAEASGFAPARSDPIVVRPGERCEGIVLELGPQAVVRGNVIAHGSGEPVTYASVSFRPLKNLRLTRTAATGNDGAFVLDSLPSGEFELDVTPALESPYADARFGPYHVQTGKIEELVLAIHEGSRVESAKAPVELEPVPFDTPLGAGHLRGVVVEAGTAIPVAQALVELFDPATDLRSHLSYAQALRGRSETDRQGHFDFGTLPGGTYSVRVIVEFSTQAWAHGITVSEGEPAETRIELEPGIHASIRLVGPHGYPVTQATVISRDRLGKYLVAPPGFDWGGDSGILELPALPAGAYEVTVVHPNYAPARIPIEIGGNSSRPALTLSPGGTLRTLVLDSTDRPVSRTEVLVLNRDGRSIFDDRVLTADHRGRRVSFPYPAPLTADDGTLLLEHVRPGAYRVSATKGSLRSNESEVSIAEGETVSVRLTLEGR